MSTNKNLFKRKFNKVANKIKHGEFKNTFVDQKLKGFLNVASVIFEEHFVNDKLMGNVRIKKSDCTFSKDTSDAVSFVLFLNIKLNPNIESIKLIDEDGSLTSVNLHSLAYKVKEKFKISDGIENVFCRAHPNFSKDINDVIVSFYFTLVNKYDELNKNLNFKARQFSLMIDHIKYLENSKCDGGIMCEGTVTTHRSYLNGSALLDFNTDQANIEQNKEASVKGGVYLFDPSSYRFVSRLV